MATLDVLEQEDTYPKLMKVTNKLQDGFNDLFGRTGYDAQAIGPGSTFNIVFTKDRISDYPEAPRADSKTRMLFDYGMLARGIHFHPDKPFYTCTEHTMGDVDETLRIAEEVLKNIRA